MEKIRIFKELNKLGFFDWYCKQYGGLNYTEYRDTFDALPLDNLIVAELYGCVFRWFREEDNGIHSFNIYDGFKNHHHYEISISYKIVSPHFTSFYEAERGCIETLITILKEN